MAQTRKRAPGAGRKPKGEFVGKSATITTRIRPDTRGALEKVARGSGRSLSQEVEFRLRASLKKPTDAQRRNQALGYAITLIAETIERDTCRSWLDDPFTSLALQHAIEAFAFHFASALNDGPAEIPPSIAELAGHMLPHFAEQFRTPAGFGNFTARYIITEIQGAARPPGIPHNEWDMPIFFTAHESVLGDIGRDLGLGAKKNRGK